MRNSILSLSISLAALSAASLSPGVAVAEEAPSILVQANGPGWITVSYRHADTEGVSSYRISRVGGISVYLDASDGQWTDVNLSPKTRYDYSVCALYKNGAEACTEGFAETTALPGPPSNWAAPSIINSEVSTDALTVYWGEVGTYPQILIHLSDPEGNVDQRDIKSVANGSYTFVGLRSNVRYRVILKGYNSLSLSGGRGPWSHDFFITTALPPGEAPPPAPPSNVALSIRALNPKTVSLEFTVRTSTVTNSQKFLIYRDRKQYAEVTQLKGIIGGFGGSYSDSVGTAERPHDYRVCFAQQPFKQVCSATVAGPEPSVGIQRMPTDVRSKPQGIDPGNPDLDVIKKPSGIKKAPRPGAVLGR